MERKELPAYSKNAALLKYRLFSVALLKITAPLKKPPTRKERRTNRCTNPSHTTVASKLFRAP